MVKSSSNPIRCGMRNSGSFLVGTWLSLVEHSLGVRGVGSSNLPVPTIDIRSEIEKYLQTLLVLRKSSTENRSRQILFEYLPFATEPLKDGIVAYLADCKRRGNTNRTLSNKLVRIKAFYATIDIKIPRKDVPRPTYVEKVPEIYPTADLARFFITCDNRQKLLFKTLLQTGLRMQEARFLEFTDIEETCVKVTAKPHWNWIPKTSDERRITIPRSLSRELMAAKGIGADLVFPTSNGKPSYFMLRTCKRIAKRAGLNPAKWSLHGFRRTYLTKIVNGAGLGLPTAMTLGGHKTTKAALRYQRPLEGDVLQQKIEGMWL
jgi:integrase